MGLRPKIRLGISTCPNDTFAFAGILTGVISTPTLDFEVELLDIQQLNDRLKAGDFDVAKTSFAAATQMHDRVILPVGSAIGYGVGPLLLSSHRDRRPDKPDDALSSSGMSVPHRMRTLCPGEGTTAAMLFDLFYPDCTIVDHVVFSDIMPMLISGEADFGVCIHEGRFTWRQQGLYLVEDLGSRWEREYGCPLPLGGLVARDDLPADTIQSIVDAIGRSLGWSTDNPTLALETMRRYAQSMNDKVLMDHVKLYVNDWTIDLGSTGRGALTHFFGLAGATPRFAF